MLPVWHLPPRVLGSACLHPSHVFPRRAPALPVRAFRCWRGCTRTAPSPLTDGKVFATPRRPYEKERLDQEMKYLGEYGLRCKREIWRVQLALAKIRKAARRLLTLDEADPIRVFEGDALLRRLARYGLLEEGKLTLDDVLSMTTQMLLSRRLQTVVLKLRKAKTMHHARTLIRQRHIQVGKQLVNVPSFLVRLDSEQHIDFARHSPFNAATGTPGRVARKRHGSAE